jgi:hypothetical protein
MSLYTSGYYEAGAEGARRRGMQGYFDVINRQREQNFAAGAQLLNIGSSLWETYSENRKLIDYAEERGLKTSTSKFTNIFGTPEFIDKNNKPWTVDMLNASMYYEDYNTSSNMLDVLKNEETE